MSSGFFTDMEHEPRQDEIIKLLCSSGGLWTELLRFIRQSYLIEGEFKYYGKKSGWAFRIHKGGKALLMLFLEEDGFKAQIVLNPEQTKKALAAGLSDETTAMLKDAKVFHDGRWLYIDLKSEKDLEDIKKLLVVKRKPVGK